MRSYRVYSNLSEERLQAIEKFMNRTMMSLKDFERLLETNVQLKGFGVSPYACAELAAEYTPDDEEYFGDSGVQVSVYPPESREEVHQKLTLDEYYAYLEDCVNCCFANRPQEEKQRIYAKLAKVKEAFRHAK